jgi:hypothetical protein
MKITKLHKALMNSEDLSLTEADDIIQEMITRVMDGENPELVLYDHGLEPDYVFDILP